MRRKAFTLVELMVVMLIIGLLIGILLPALNNAIEAGRRVQCLGNLSGFGKSISMYSNANGGSYPCATANATFTGALDTQFSLWLMVMGKYSPATVFCCQSELAARTVYEYKDTSPDPNKPFPWVYSNGSITGSGTQYRCYSYSYQVPNAKKGNPGGNISNASKFAIMADQAPFMINCDATKKLTVISDSTVTGAAAGKASQQAQTYLAGNLGGTLTTMNFNSPNHKGAGQNVLFQDGHASWWTHPFCGISDDNIFTMGGATEQLRVVGALPTTTGGPATDEDSQLCNMLDGAFVGDGPASGGS